MRIEETSYLLRTLVNYYSIIFLLRINTVLSTIKCTIYIYHSIITVCLYFLFSNKGSRVPIHNARTFLHVQ